MNKKRTQIFYEYNGQTITFGFEEDFEGVISGGGLKCRVLREDGSVDVVIVDPFGQKLLHVITTN